MKTEVDNNWMRVRSVAAGFVRDGSPCRARAGGRPADRGRRGSFGRHRVGGPASMHIANGDTDVGPGSDEALLAMSPSNR